MNLGQVYTRREVADFMVTLFSLPKGSKILDPCFGEGVFLYSLADLGKYHINGIEIDKNSFQSVERRRMSDYNHIGYDLHCGDFFKIDKSSQWDGIIMNPPYVRQEEIDTLDNAYGINKQYLKAKIGNVIDAKSNLYMYFILYAISLLREDGELVVIFPGSWSNAKSGRLFIQTMMSNTSIVEKYEVQGNPFVGNPMVDVVILKIIKKTGLKQSNFILTVNDGKVIVKEKEERVSLPMDNALQLKHIANIRRGITMGANKIFINPDLSFTSNFNRILSSPKQVVGFTTDDAKLDRWFCPEDKESLNNDERRYLHLWEEQILRDKDPKTLYEQIIQGKGWYLFKTKPKGQILFPYIIRENIKFILNTNNYYARDNFYLITTYIEPLLLMALLNNYYIWYQLENCGKEYGNNVLKIQKYDVDNLLIINPVVISKDNKIQLENLASQLCEFNESFIEIINEITGILEPYYGLKDIYKHWYNVYAKRNKKE